MQKGRLRICLHGSESQSAFQSTQTIRLHPADLLSFTGFKVYNKLQDVAVSPAHPALSLN